jgi:acyl-CoA synthetase (AMP-forming)/AMP-acid ligase II
MRDARFSGVVEHTHTRAYLRRGGPWDVGSLGAVLSGGAHVLLRDGDTSLTASETAERAARIAGALSESGVRPGDVVTWQLPNCHEAVLLYRACWSLGAVALPLHHRHRQSELRPVLDLLRPTAFFASPDAPLEALRECVIVRTGEDSLPMADEISGVSTVDPGSPALVMMTTGTTAASKLVVHTHRTLAYKAVSKRDVYGLGRGDVLLLASPMSHANGLVNGVLLPAVASMTVVLMEAWDPERAMELIERERVTFLGGPSAFLTSIVDSPGFDARRLDSLRLVAMGGSSMTPSLLTELGAKVGCQVKRTYGSTEALSIVTTHVGDDPAMGWQTDGRPSGEAEVIIIDPATADQADPPTPLGPGEIGEIWVRGPEVFVGYVDADDTTAAFRHGWFRTGDLGVLDKQGWLTVAGRLKDLIIRGGENIVPAEVERFLEAHPGVRRAVAIGYPDRVLGERVAAVVEADGAFDLVACRQWFADSGVAKFKTPERILCVDAIPMNLNGKPNRVALDALLDAKD